MILRQLKVNRASTRRRLFKAAPVVLMLVLAACGGGEQAAAPTDMPTATAAVQPTAQTDSGAVVVETGGMALPAAPTPTPTAGPVLEVGAELTVAATVVLRAEPGRAAPGFAEYPAGSRFIVVEPHSDYAAYPVTVEGQRWYRVRAADGLVGWMVEE